MRFFLFILFLPLLLLSCEKKTQEDPRIAQLQKDVARLSEENKQLEQSLGELRDELEQSQTQQVIPAPQTAQAPSPPAMTVDRMKAGVQPVLEEVIRKVKEASDTPRKGTQYGMRTEYDLQHAVFGLIQTRDRRAPYAARVIVKYEKYLESQIESHSYGSGSDEFYFVYRNGKWVHERRQ